MLKFLVIIKRLSIKFDDYGFDFGNSVINNWDRYRTYVASLQIVEVRTNGWEVNQEWKKTVEDGWYLLNSLICVIGSVKVYMLPCIIQALHARQ